MRVTVLLVLLLSWLLPIPGRADPAAAKAYYQKGMAEFMLDHYDGAIAEFERGFREQPLPEFLYNIARAHDKAGRPAQAIAYYRKYLELAPAAGDRVAVESRIAELEPAAKAAPTPTSATPPAASVEPGAPAPSPLVTDRVERKPVTKRPWFWVTVVGGVAVVGAAVAVGVVFGRPHDPTPSLFTVQGP